MHVEGGGGVDGVDGAIVCLLTPPRQKVSPIYHNLTFSDSIQVSQGPKRECFKGVRTLEKREISSRLVTAKEKHLRFFLYVVVCKVFHLSSDSLHHRTPKGTECEIIPLRGMLIKRQCPTRHPPSPQLSIHNCFPGLRRKRTWSCVLFGASTIHWRYVEIQDYAPFGTNLA